MSRNASKEIQYHVVLMCEYLNSLYAEEMHQIEGRFLII